MPAPPPLQMRPPSTPARVLAAATVVVAAVVASATLWLPLYTIDSGEAGPQPRVPLVQASGTTAVVGAVALCGPLFMAVALLVGVWVGSRALALAIAVILAAWTAVGFLTILIGGLTAPVAALGMTAALLTPASKYAARG